MVKIECPNCAADLDVPADAPIHTCEYCGTAIQVSKIIGAQGGEGGETTTITSEDKKKLMIKDHYIIRCKYNRDFAKSLLVDWVQKIPGAPENFEAEANISKLDLKFYPIWVGELSATSDYVGIDDWPRFSKPAIDKPGWYEHVSYYKHEESGHVVREYQVPILALNLEKIPKYLRTYIVSTTGKEYFDINHCKKLGGDIIDSIYTLDQVRNMVQKEAFDRQTAEMHKEVKKITSRNDDIKLRGLFYIHFPVYEVEFTYKGKPHNALIDGSNGRIIHVKVPVSVEFRLKTLLSGFAFVGTSILMFLLGALLNLAPFFNIGSGIFIFIIGLMFFGLNLRKKASERQV
ncbi:MAG: hypothetical protein ACTSVI_14235 [Promethearchaeota archaeon]